jgi:hypothetical protein
MVLIVASSAYDEMHAQPDHVAVELALSSIATKLDRRILDR